MKKKFFWKKKAQTLKDWCLVLFCNKSSWMMIAGVQWPSKKKITLQEVQRITFDLWPGLVIKESLRTCCVGPKWLIDWSIWLQSAFTFQRYSIEIHRTKWMKFFDASICLKQSWTICLWTVFLLLQWLFLKYCFSFLFFFLVSSHYLSKLSNMVWASLIYLSQFCDHS